MTQRKYESEEREYSILPVMSELSTVRWTAVKGSRDRSSDRAADVASTPGSRAQAATEDGFLGLCHKTKLADGG